MYPFSSAGIGVEQPFGRFILTAVPARVLLDTAYSDRLTATLQKDGSYKLSGSQRELAAPRLKDIGRFIDTGAACCARVVSGSLTMALALALRLSLRQDVMLRVSVVVAVQASANRT